MSEEPTYYRVEDHRTAGSADEYGEPIPGSSSPGFRLRTYRVVKRTPKGVRVQETFYTYDCADPPRFILAGATKQFASPSIDEAVLHWRARKAKQRRIYERRVRDIDEALAAIDQQVRQWKRTREKETTK